MRHVRCILSTAGTLNIVAGAWWAVLAAAASGSSPVLMTVSLVASASASVAGRGLLRRRARIHEVIALAVFSAVCIVAAIVLATEQKQKRQHILEYWRAHLPLGDSLLPAPGQHLFALKVLAVPVGVNVLAAMLQLVSLPTEDRHAAKLCAGAAHVAGALVAGAVVSFSTAVWYGDYLGSHDPLRAVYELALAEPVEPFPEVLRRVGPWVVDATEMSIHRPHLRVTPHRVLRRPLPASDWHIWTLEGGRGPLRKNSAFEHARAVAYEEMERHMPWPRELVFIYCQDFAVLPTRQDPVKYICGANRFASAAAGKRWVSGVTLVGVDPIYGVNIIHDRYNSFPVLNATMSLWEELGRPPDVSVLCFPQACDLLRKSTRQVGIVEEDVVRVQHFGIHLEHAVIPVFVTAEGSGNWTALYPRTAYDLPHREETSRPRKRGGRGYVVYCSRRPQASRRVPPEVEDRLLGMLNETLIAANGPELRVFRRPSYELSHEDVEDDAELFHGALAVLNSVLGSATLNLIQSRPGTVVVEMLLRGPAEQTSIHTISIGYARDLRYFAYMPSAEEAKSWGHFDTRELYWFNASEFHDFAISVLYATGIL